MTHKLKFDKAVLVYQLDDDASVLRVCANSARHPRATGTASAAARTPSCRPAPTNARCSLTVWRRPGSRSASLPVSAAAMWPRPRGSVASTRPDRDLAEAQADRQARAPIMGAAAVSVTGRTAARMRSTQARSTMRAHARIQVASACRACGEHVDARRSTRRFCSGACRQAAWRSERPLPRPVAHQRRIREREAARDPRPADGYSRRLHGRAKFRSPRPRRSITRYEWLGSMPTGPRACYGLKDSRDGELASASWSFAARPCA